MKTVRAHRISPALLAAAALLSACARPSSDLAQRGGPAARDPVAWCNANSPNASQCAAEATGDEESCRSMAGQGYDRCRRELDNIRLHSAPGLSDN
jgi:hypothetical protein